MNRLHSIIVVAVCAACAVIHAQAGLSGKWHGLTPSGQQLVLDIEVKGQQLTGQLTLNEQSADITEGKVEEKTFSFKATIDGKTITFDGQLVGEGIELTPQGVGRTVTLKRVK